MSGSLSFPVNVTKSQIVKTTQGDRLIDYSSRIYIDCLCDSLKHIARIIINKRIERGPEDNSRWFISDDEVYLEFNATHAIDPSEDMFDINRTEKSRPSIISTLAGNLRRVFRRWSAAWRLILGKEVYFCSDIILDHNHARKFSECLIEAIDEMKDVGGSTLGTENNAL